MTTDALPVDDQTLVALSPGALATAQADLTAWVEAKITETEAEFDVAQESVHQAVEARLANVGSFRGVLAACRKRLVYYEQLKAALGAGYLLIPPLPVDVFAIRTDRETPRGTASHDYGPPNPRFGALAQSAQVGLMPGEGRYVSPTPEADQDTIDVRKADGKTGKQYLARATAFQGVAFPVALVRPQVIEATGRALAALVFDELGLVGGPRTDPMVVGRILHYRKLHEPATFFVAWWLDTRTLK